MLLESVKSKRNLESNGSFLLSSNSLQNFKQTEQKTPEILHIQFSLSCRIVSVTLYSGEN